MGLFTSFAASAIVAVASSLATNAVTLSNVNDVYKVAHSTELVNIYKASTKNKGKIVESSLYYVVCRGLDLTETDMSKSRSIINAIKIGISNENNSYVKTVVDAVTSTVPVDSKIIFAGHSMGGMVIQQAIANDTLKDNYNILHTLSVGAPYIITSGEKEGSLIRAVDNLDPIPFVSIPFLANPLIGNIKTETSFKFGLVHFKSYDEGDCWDKYDALGNYKGKGKTGYQVVLNELVYSIDTDGNSKI